MPTASNLLSYEEWLALPQEGEGREECVNGVVEKTPPPKSDHAFIVENLADLLRFGLDRRLARVLTTNFGLVIRTQPLTQRTPDIAVFLRATMVIRDGYFHSPPELAVEVLSPANTSRRVTEKLADYASIRLPEVWVVNPGDRTVTAHVLNNREYRSTVLAHDSVTAPARFPSLSIDFTDIWR